MNLASLLWLSMGQIMTNHWILGCPMALQKSNGYHVVAVPPSYPFEIPFHVVISCHISTLVSLSLDLKPMFSGVHGFPEQFPDQCHYTCLAAPSPLSKASSSGARPSSVESNESIRFYGQVTQGFDWVDLIYHLMISILREEL